MRYQPIDACRSCGSKQLAEVLNLGFFAISDFLDSPDAFVDRAPLELVRCEDCTLVQLRHTVDRDRLYRSYWYRSGTNPSMVSSLRDVARDATSRVSLRPGDVVLDIGANDGTLLHLFREVAPEARLMAYEPATNLWPDIIGDDGPWNERGIRLSGGYFPTVIQGKPVGMEPGAKIITSCACFYDVDDPNVFVEGIKANLHPDGVWINQMSYLPDTLLDNNFGDICHEHLTYWSGDAFFRLLGRHGLEARHFTVNDVNGGSIRFIVQHEDVPIEPGTQPAYSWGDSPWLEELAKFRERVQLQRTEVRCWLQAAKREGAKVVGYGASTKGNTYLQYWGIGPDLLECIADRNPDKWGKYTPTGQRVIFEEEARAMRPDYFFCLPWHFIDSFVEREHAFLQDGGEFVVPFPELHFVGGEDLADVPAQADFPNLSPAL